MQDLVLVLMGVRDERARAKLLCSWTSGTRKCV